MLLFAGNMVIPERRLISIDFVESSIKIIYDCGEFVSVEGMYVPRVGTFKLVLSDEEEVNKIKRQFYKACKEGSQVFYFG